MRIALLTSVLCIAACGGSDNRPANDPSSTASGTSTTLTGAPSSAYDPAAATPQAAPVPNAAPSTLVTTGPGAPSDVSAPSVPPPASGPAANATDTTPSRSDVPVAGDPGSRDPSKKADNTRNNERDRHGTLTPMNQGNSRDETKITAAIRKDVMADKSLSFAAKNVKIVTVGTKVTLRGAVNSDQEKAAIEAHARQASGVTDVDNQIDVKK